MPLVTVPIAAATVAEIHTQTLQAKAAGADLVELRLDRCGEVEAIIAAIPHLELGCIATIRHENEKGGWSGSEDERLRLFKAADDAGAEYIDLEVAFLASWRPKKARLILSYHDFEGMGGSDEEWATRIETMRAAGPDVIAKIAVTASDAADLARIERVYREHGNGPLVAIAMGEHGFASRLLAGVWGGFIAFARLPNQAGSAPAQPFIADLLHMYRLRQQNSKTEIYAVIGNPISHSLSPLIHNAGFREIGRNAVYVPIRVENAIKFWNACGKWITGLSITIPHKQSLLPLNLPPEPLARRIGVINTIWRREGLEITTANTDAFAIAECILRKTGRISESTAITTDQRSFGSVDIKSMKGLRVLILGAGGAGRAAAFACAAHGAIVKVWNRTPDRAIELAQDCHLDCEAVDDEKAKHWGYDVLINGTSVGMRQPDGTDPNETPWDAERHRRGTIVFDTVYIPLRTRLLREAEDAGATTICGADMFIAQAAGQFSRWTNESAPVQVMRELVLKRLGS